MVESPFEYTPSVDKSLFPRRHERRKEQSTQALVDLVRAFKERRVPIKAVSNCLREPGKWDEYICGFIGGGFEYLSFPWQPLPSRGDQLRAFLNETVELKILLTGGFIRIESSPAKDRVIVVNGCVGHRAGWLYETVQGFGKKPAIFIDPKSSVIDLRRKEYRDLNPDKLYLVGESFPRWDDERFRVVTAGEV